MVRSPTKRAIRAMLTPVYGVGIRLHLPEGGVLMLMDIIAESFDGKQS